MLGVWVLGGAFEQDEVGGGGVGSVCFVEELFYCVRDTNRRSASKGGSVESGVGLYGYSYA